MNWKGRSIAVAGAMWSRVSGWNGSPTDVALLPQVIGERDGVPVEKNSGRGRPQAVSHFRTAVGRASDMAAKRAGAAIRQS